MRKTVPFQLELHDTGVDLYKIGPDYVQVVNLGQGASIKLLHGEIAALNIPPYGIYRGNNSTFSRQTLKDTWDKFGPGNNAFSITNGAFFADNPWRRPVPIAWPLKVNGKVMTEGYAKHEFVGQRLMLEIWSNRANITPLSENALLYSSAPNIIAGLIEEADKEPEAEVGRTFIGIDDTNRVFIFNSSNSTQAHAASVLRDNFDVDNVIMLDGGGSTGLICNDLSYVPVPSSRKIPQTIVVFPANVLPNLPPSGSDDSFIKKLIHIFPGYVDI